MWTPTRTWWAFAHAVGPCAHFALFGGRQAPYTIPQLLTLVRAEPIPALAIGGIHKRCHEKNLQTEEPLRLSSYSVPMSASPSTTLSVAVAGPSPAPLSGIMSIFVGDRAIPIKYLPTVPVGALGPVQKQNLAKWLVNTPTTTIVTDTSKTQILFSVLKTLLPPSEISPPLVEFFCWLDNRKAILGKMAVASESILQADMNRTFSEFLDSLRLPNGSRPCKVLLCPVQLTRATVAFVVRKTSPAAQVFNWMHEDLDLIQEIESTFSVCTSSTLLDL